MTDYLKKLTWISAGGVGLLSLHRIYSLTTRNRTNQNNQENIGAKNNIVIVGSANTDIYIELAVIPSAGETVDGVISHIGPGGKGANQAAAAARSCSPTYSVSFIGKLGIDQYSELFMKAFKESSIDVSLVERLTDTSTGQAYILLDEIKQNSIVIALGANLCWKTKDPTPGLLTQEMIKSIQQANCVILQREIPDDVNLAVAKIAYAAEIPIFLDLGGVASPPDKRIFPYLTVLSMNETELGRVVGVSLEIPNLPPASPSIENSLSHISKNLSVKIDEKNHFTHSPSPVSSGSLDIAQICDAVEILQKQGAQTVLVTLGSHGSLLIGSEGHVLARQPAFPIDQLVDTAGAGDAFRGTFAVAYVEGYSWTQCLQFASAASAYCVQRKGTFPAMPTREEIDKLLLKELGTHFTPSKSNLSSPLNEGSIQEEKSSK